MERLIAIIGPTAVGKTALSIDLAHKLKDTLRSKILELGHVLIHIEPNE